MSVCRSCQQEVMWVVVAASSKRMPLDPDPTPTGTIVRLEGDTARVLTGDDLAYRRRMPGGPGPLYVSHFSTCPEGAQWRRPR